MGFTEVSGPIIESAFWNFDALFSPQDHPTRDMQDTFFLKNPKKIDIDDIALDEQGKEDARRELEGDVEGGDRTAGAAEDPHNKRVCTLHKQIRRRP